MRQGLAHEIGQRLTRKLGARDKARSLRGRRAGRDLRSVDHKLQRKVRKDVGDDAGKFLPRRLGTRQARRRRERAEGAGAYARYMTPAELGKYTETELEYWSAVIRKAGITGEAQ